MEVVSMGFLRESSLVLYKNLFIDANVGTLGSVEFNFESIWRVVQKFKETEGDTFDPQELVFIHTHSKEVGIDCSSTDIDCMKGLNIAFGFPVAFYIACFNEETTKWEMQGYKLIDCENENGIRTPILFKLNKDLDLPEDAERTLRIFSFSKT
jgi:hypothetical protein